MTTTRQDSEYEQEIVEKNLIAPRITNDRINSLMAQVSYHYNVVNTSTFCHAFLHDKFFLATGHSACVSPENFDEGIGRRMAFDSAAALARNRLWELEGYNLYQQLNDQERIARVCHEVNRAYCQALGDMSQPSWEEAPEWQRSSARMGVDLHTMGNFGPEASHISWMRQKASEGWKYGPVKDADKKEHPCFVPFDQLPTDQQAKDFIFRAVVHAMRGVK